MIHSIHQTSEDRRTHASEKTTEMLSEHAKMLKESIAVLRELETATKDSKQTERIVKQIEQSNELLATIKDPKPEDVVRKLEEVKSALLVANRLLKKMNDRVSDELNPTELMRIVKGDKGDKGEKGDKGDRGDRGEIGATGPKGKDGRDGKDTIGIAGKDGKDGSPDTPDEVVGKVNQAKKKIEPKQVKGLLELVDDIDNITKYPRGGGGRAPFIIQNGGTKLSDHVTHINFGAGLTASYSNGTILVTANTSGSVLTATGTINDTNLDFTFTQQPSVLIVNGGTYQQAGGAITWTWTEATLTATLSVAPGTNGSIFGLL